MPTITNGADGPTASKSRPPIANATKIPRAPKKPFIDTTAPRSVGRASCPTSVTDAQIALVCPIDNRMNHGSIEKSSGDETSHIDE